MGTATSKDGVFAALGSATIGGLGVLGDFGLFALQTFRWMTRRRPGHSTLLRSLYVVGVRSVPVIVITGVFLGMVMAIQLYHQLHQLGLETRLGALIDITLVRELAPTLAATMLAGRVGSAMAAELATMRVTDQIDAVHCLGVSPFQYLVAPRFLACTLLVPLLTVVANMMGILGGAFVCLQLYNIESHFYWSYAQGYIDSWDVMIGLIKSLFFGAAIGLIACHRGFNSRGGAEGVGRAATEAFVASFVAILVLNFFLDVLLINLESSFLPLGKKKGLIG